MVTMKVAELIRADRCELSQHRIPSGCKCSRTRWPDSLPKAPYNCTEGNGKHRKSRRFWNDRYRNVVKIDRREILIAGRRKERDQCGVTNRCKAALIGLPTWLSQRRYRRNR